MVLGYQSAVAVVVAATNKKLSNQKYKRAIFMENVSLLIVEDDKDVRESVARVLQDDGYIVLEASDGGAGIEMIRQHSTDLSLVITDLNMRPVDGVEVVEMIGREANHLPVIAYSALMTEEVRQKLDRRVVRRTFGKPFDLKELRSAVKELIRASGE